MVNVLQSGLLGRVAADGGYAVAVTHTKKVKKYGERCEAEGMAFLALAVDTLEGWHKEAISKLGRQLARVVGRDEGRQASTFGSSLESFWYATTSTCWPAELSRQSFHRCQDCCKVM